MIFFEKFKIKLLKYAKSCFFPSIVTISILGIVNQSVAQSETVNKITAQNIDEQDGFIAVMRLSRPNEFLFIRRSPIVIENIKQAILRLPHKKPKVDYLKNSVLKIQYLAEIERDFPNYLSPTTIVELSDCTSTGWCRLRNIVSSKTEPSYIKEHGGLVYQKMLKDKKHTNSQLQLWVPSNDFCDLTGQAQPLMNCSEPTRKMVTKNPEVKNFINNHQTVVVSEPNAAIPPKCFQSPVVNGKTF